jgi:ankyrin repeat protein
VAARLAEGASVEERGGEFETTCLTAAVEWGHEEVVDLLLERGADVNAEDMDEWTALHWACYMGREWLVRRILDHPGVECNLRNGGGQAQYSGLTPLMVAVVKGQVEAVRAMVTDPRVEVDIKTEGERLLLERVARWAAVVAREQRREKLGSPGS